MVKSEKRFIKGPTSIKELHNIIGGKFVKTKRRGFADKIIVDKRNNPGSFDRELAILPCIAGGYIIECQYIDMDDRQKSLRDVFEKINKMWP